MLAALVVCICAFFAMPDADVARITALIGAFGDLAIYMLSEALVDAANGTKTEISRTDRRRNLKQRQRRCLKTLWKSSGLRAIRRRRLSKYNYY